MNGRKLFGILAVTFGIGAACSISLADVSWVAAGLLWIAIALKDRQWPSWKTTGLEWPMGLFALWSLIVSNWSAPAGEIFHNYKSETLLIVFLVMTQVFNQEDNRRFLKAFLIGSLVSAVIGCLQAWGGLNWDPTTHERTVPGIFQSLANLPFGIFRYISLRDMRAVGFRSIPLTYSECLLAAFFLFLSASLETNSLRSHWRQLVSAMLAGLAIFFSQTRGAWVGLAAGLLVLMAIQRRRHTWRVVGIIMVFSGLAFWAAPSARLRLASVYQPVSGQDEASKDVRKELWTASLKIIEAHPATGAGTGNIRILLPKGRFGNEGLETWTESHNIYLQQAAEKGLLGLGLFLWLLWGIGQLFQRAATPWRDGLMAGLAGLLVCGLTESWCNDSTVLMMVFALAGCAWQLRARE